MSKTKTKTEMALVSETAESSSYKRQRMLDVRRMVAKAVKQGRRVDQLGLTGTDIARSQIALQDLLDREKERHARARSHIVDQKEIIEIITVMSMLISESATESLLRDQDRIAELATAFYSEQNLHQLAQKAVHEVLNENSRLTGELEDTMNTLRVALNGSTNG